MFSRVSVLGLYSRNQYSSSNSTMLAFLHASTAFLALFFYPIHHIGFVHLQYFPYAPSADSSVVHFDRQLPGLFRVFVPFRVYGVIDAALLTFAALAPRSVIPRLDLVLYLSAFWASFPCLFCALSHIFYYTIKSLFWTLPPKAILHRPRNQMDKRAHKRGAATA